MQHRQPSDKRRILKEKSEKRHIGPSEKRWISSKGVRKATEEAVA